MEEFNHSLALAEENMPDIKKKSSKQKDALSKLSAKIIYQEDDKPFIKYGELYFTLDFLENWDIALEELNRGKVGRKFESPWSFIEFLKIIAIVFHLPYRRMEELLRKLSEHIPKIRPTDYTNISKRCAKLNINLTYNLLDNNETIVIFMDSSGIKIMNFDNWSREKWKICRGWIKVFLAVNTKSKEITRIEIIDET